MSDDLTQRFIDSAKAIEGRRGIDVLFDLVDEAIGSTDPIFKALGHATPERSGYEAIDAGLAQLDPEGLSTHGILAVLTITLGAANRLPNRREFYRKSYETLSQRRPEEVKALLQGLEGRGLG